VREIGTVLQILDDDVGIFLLGMNFEYESLAPCCRLGRSHSSESDARATLAVSPAFLAATYVVNGITIGSKIPVV
jgi:hypothetical protein